MSLTISTRAFDGIKLLGGSPVVPFTGKLRVRSTARPPVPVVAQNGVFVAATISLPSFPGIRLPRAYVDPAAIGRPGKPADFRKSHKRTRRKLRKEMARYGRKRRAKRSLSLADLTPQLT